MTEPRHKFYGISISDWIDTIDGDLENDSISLAEIIPTGRDDFNLQGELLLDFTRKCIQKLLYAGAKPIDGKKDENGKFISSVSKKYGYTYNEIIENIISEWQEEEKKGNGDFYCWGIWFGLPKFIKNYKEE